MTSEPLNSPLAGLDSEPEQAAVPASPLDRIKRFIKFGIVGGSGVVVNLAIFQLAFWLLLPLIAHDATRHTASNALGILVSIFGNFLLNDAWTWGDRDKGSGARNWWTRLAKYYVTCSIAAAVQLGLSSALFALVFSRLELQLFGVDLGPNLAVLIGIVCGIAINFPLSHFWAFRDAQRAAPDATHESSETPHRL